jgi:redox-sensitive bicupin YhaK (pirin superfamily)
MIEHRRFSDIGGSDLGWLKAKHHFAIGPHGNPAHAALGNLYVLNDDEIAPGTGFPLHPHASVEIITYVREGALTHRDSLGNEGRTAAGDVQVMSAGTGIRHSEENAETSTTKVFQIWLHPRSQGGAPRWGNRPFPRADRAGRLIVLASGFAADSEALPIRADARVMGATLKAGQRISYVLDEGRMAYLVPAHGDIIVNGFSIHAREGAAIHQDSQVEIEAQNDSEILLIDAGLGLAR